MKLRDPGSGVLSLVLFGAVCGIAGYYLHSVIADPVYIKGKTVTRTKYIKVVSTREDYKKAYETPIEIHATTTNDWINITATDTYKQSEKGFQVGTAGNFRLYACIGAVGLGAGMLIMAFR